MDAYTLHLLGMAVEAAERTRLGLHVVPRPWSLRASLGTKRHGHGPTLDAALAALLWDLGVEVPERPTAERRDEVWQHLNEAEHNGEFLDGMRDYPDRLAVLALLEDGGG